MEGGDHLHPRNKGLKLFGVRIVDDEAGLTGDDVMRKSASMGNLASAYAAAEQVGTGENGYLSDGGLQLSSRRRRLERKRGIPWTEEEHRTFLAGLQKLGKGDWRGISRNFVTTRTPTQVASHAQKYFLRQSNLNKKKRRSSLFDVIIDETISAAEIALKPSLMNTTESAEVVDQLDRDDNMVNGSVVKDRVVPVLNKTLSFAEYAKVSISSKPAICSPDFLGLSLQFSKFPAQSTITSSKVDTSDLELSIAPPQPSTLAKLSSQSVTGIIRVI